MPAKTCRGIRRDGRRCTRPPGWGLDPDDPEGDAFCRDHTPTKTRKAEDLKKRLVELLESEDVTIAQAARELGTSTTRIFFLRRNDQDFDAKIVALSEANNAVRVENVESSMYNRLVNASLEDSVPAALFVFYLCNRDPDRWRSVQHIRVGGPDGGPLEFELSNAKQLLEDRVNRVASRVGASLPVQVPNGRGSP